MEYNEFNLLLKKNTEYAEAVINKYLPKEEGYQKEIMSAMNYSVLAGGKRLRPMLVMETFKLFGGEGDVHEPFMAAMEMIHTYSLVHDDLPAMDNDEYRRGRETTWKVYGEGVAVLAGDALLNFAYETALKAFERADDIDLFNRIAASLKVLAGKAGIYGMVGGQTVDVLSEGAEEKIDLDKLLFIHEHKTAALIQASMMIGAILAGASDEDIKKIEKCAYNIGIAFQIQDDILDVVGDSTELGKPVGSDESNEKQTYVTLKGLEASTEEVSRLSNESIKILDEINAENAFLRELIFSLTNRRK